MFIIAENLNEAISYAINVVVSDNLVGKHKWLGLVETERGMKEKNTFKRLQFSIIKIEFCLSTKTQCAMPIHLGISTQFEHYKSRHS